jgi:rhodanese-related sulfurtransferase
MRVIPFVHEGLGNSSYIVELDNGSAIAIDPDRSVARYLGALRADGVALAGVFETHLHADFVSGARELSAVSKSPLFVPEGAASKLPHRPIHGGKAVALDGCEVTAVASPGHTPEHLSYVVRGASAPPTLFSGGSLIVGGAARTDLISADMTESLTRDQFRTIRQSFAELPDETLLFPTHGGGSFCSTGAGGERTSTLGRERRENPLLAMADEDEFVRWFPTTFPAVPDYFFRLRAVNQKGPRLRHDIPAPRPLDVEEFATLQAQAVVIDVRNKEAYARGHIPGSLNNTLRDVYPVWLGWLVPADARLLFVADEQSIEEVVDQSLLVGYEDFAGWLLGGAEAWQSSGRELAKVRLVNARVVRKLLGEGAASLDVREADEYQAGHIEGSIHVPLGRLIEDVDRVPRDRPVVVYCGHGERSSTAASLLERAGFRDLVNLDGGTGAWEDSGYDLTREA